MCRSSSPSFLLGLAVGGRVRLSPFAVRPFAAGEPHVRRHSCFSPAVYGTRAGHPSAQHFSLHHAEHLQGFCSTTGTFLPPTERSNRGSTAVGSRTRVLQPLLPRSKEGWRLEAYSGSTAFEFFPLQREVQDADDENHHVSGPGGRLVCHH